MQSKTFAIWGGRFRDTATAWRPGAGPADVLDMFQVGGPFTRPEADQACLDSIRRNMDVCAHRMLVAELASQSYDDWAAEITRVYQAGLDATPASG